MSKLMLPNLGFFISAADAAATVEWLVMGHDRLAPNLIKTLTIAYLMKVCGLSLLVETGTRDGDMAHLISSLGSEVVTIELSEELHAQALRRFAAVPAVRCLRGDSGVVLPAVIRDLDRPALFWLDAHYSGPGTAGALCRPPLLDELAALAAARGANREMIDGSAILIDDVRCFDGALYPALQQVLDLAAAAFPCHVVSVVNDAVRILPDRSRRGSDNDLCPPDDERDRT